ncbi:tyrosine-type recombinase/integrase [Ensifer sp. ENS09]|uniref:tyrosine-type recombinase/integrase n=1 Tax=Ensifer sp. ENS09 TaxID=2769263 RepID=UPI0017873CEE|nr:site-specific integrase [Ensifer sp. ENS09]MBD9652927.1 tyrosine-type recombinase/integrase [Ensifer sp. ENS09]
MAKISIQTIRELLKAAVGTVLRDSELKGFQARRIVAGISYFYEYRNGSGRGSEVKRVPLGRSGDALTPEQARERARAHVRNKLNGRDPSAERAELKEMPTLGAFAEEWITAREGIAKQQPLHARPKASTLETYRSLMKKHVGPAFGKRKLTEITHEEVEKFHLKLGLTNPVVANRCLQLISSLYGKAAKSKHISRNVNPAKWIEKFEEFGCERYLAVAEMIKLGDAILIAETTGIPYTPPEAKPGKQSKYIGRRRPPYVISANAADAIRLLALMGTRLGENLDAKWTDIDFELGVLRRPTKVGFRPILIPDAGLEILRRMPRIGEYVFPQDSDPTRPKSDVKKQWRAVLKFADIGHVRIHDLRHSFASVAILTGGSSLEIVGSLLGHKQAKTTKRYAHIGESPARRVLEASADLIGNALNRRRTAEESDGAPS